MKICGMWDFWGEKMWDVGFFRPKNVGCGILGPPYKPPSRIRLLLVAFFENLQIFAFCSIEIQ